MEILNWICSVIMDMVSEFLFEFLAIVVIAVFCCGLLFLVTNQRIKSRTKTILFLIGSELMCAFVGVMSWLAYCGGNSFGGIFGGAAAAVMAIVFLFVTLCGNRKSWQHQ